MSDVPQSGGKEVRRALNGTPEHSYRPAGEIRTFALRQARMSPSQRRDFDTLSHKYRIDFKPEPTNVKACFPDPALPLILEIGFGMGESTARIAAERPNSNYLGVEVYRPGVGKLLGLIDSHGLANVRIISHDAVDVLREMIPDGLLDGVHIFYPDPWPKKRHHKRRLVQPGFVELLRPKIRVGGYIYLVTDWADYAEQMLLVLDTARGFENPCGGFCQRRPWRPETSFERKGVARDHTIHDLWVVRSV